MAGRILIADDVATNRIVLKVKLMAACYEVLQASGGAEAIECARTDAPDLILLDLLMPDMDGVAVCKQLKEDPLTAHIPIIMVTAHSLGPAIQTRNCACAIAPAANLDLLKRQPVSRRPRPSP